MQPQASQPSPFFTSLLVPQPSGDIPAGPCQAELRDVSAQSLQSQGSQLVHQGAAYSMNVKLLRHRLSLVQQEPSRQAAEGSASHTLHNQHSSQPQQQPVLGQPTAQTACREHGVLPGTNKSSAINLTGPPNAAVLAPSSVMAAPAVDVDGSSSSSSTSSSSSLSAVTHCGHHEDGDSGSSMVLSTPSNLVHMDTTAPLDTWWSDDGDDGDDGDYGDDGHAASGHRQAAPGTPGRNSSCHSYGPFAAFQSHGYADSATNSMAAAAAGEWLIGTASSTGGHSLHSSASRRTNSRGVAGSIRSAHLVCSPCAEEEQEEATDPLIVAAHAAIAAAAAAAPPGTTTSAADMHTLLATCNGGTVLLLGHGSTTIGPSTATGAQAFTNLEDVLQQHRTTCSLCSLSPMESPRGQPAHQQLQQQLQQQSIDESTELDLSQVDTPCDDNSISLVLPLRRVVPISSARAGLLFRRSSSSGSAAAAALAAAGVDRLDTSDSTCSCRSVLVLGLGSGSVDMTGGCQPVGGISAAAGAPAGQQRAINLPGECPIVGVAPAASAPPAFHQHQPQQPRQQQQQQQQPQQQPVMQLLSCSTLLSPSCSSTKLGTCNSVGNSCLRIGSFNMGSIFAGPPATLPAACSSSQGKQQQLPSKASQGCQQQQQQQQAWGQHQVQQQQQQQQSQKQRQLIYLLD